jgi:hypothetical protein
MTQYPCLRPEHPAISIPSIWIVYKGNIKIQPNKLIRKYFKSKIDTNNIEINDFKIKIDNNKIEINDF